MHRSLGLEQRNALSVQDQMAQCFDATTDAIVFLDRGYQFTAIMVA